MQDSYGNIYYHGMAGPDARLKDVERRHAGKGNRFDPTMGDLLVPVEGRRTYGEARIMEHQKILEDDTLLNDRKGKNKDNYRGNRQKGISDRKLKKYC